MKKRILIATIVLMAFALTAGAAETEYSGIMCGHAKSTLLYSAPDLTVFNVEVWAIHTPASTFEPWKDASVHCVGYNRITQGKLSQKGSCLWTDATGDTFIGEYELVADTPGVWTFLSGTGKWKGIEGGGTYQAVSRGKEPFADGTRAFCNSHSGKYTLP